MITTSALINGHLHSVTPSAGNSHTRQSRLFADVEIVNYRPEQFDIDVPNELIGNGTEKLNINLTVRLSALNVCKVLYVA